MENHADLLVIFGITGDLARRMTFRALYRLERRGLLDSPVIGVASEDMTTGELVKHAREAIGEGGQDVDDAVFGRLARRMSYLHGDVTDAALYRRLAAQVGRAKRPLYYLEVPPSLFGPIVEQLGAAKLLREGRVAVEKPFGHDLASARELNARLHRLLRESQILRVDHFLGKEPVIELEYLRFANLALAELWERTSVSAVQITMAEDFGVEGRGRFYDSVGALRDVVQNHLLQVLALVAMDPPAGGSADDTQDKKAEVFRAMPPADPQHYVRGQYQGYADIPGVARGSATETYVALRLEIDNWRWAGRPRLPAGRQGAAAQGHRGAAAPAPHAPAGLPAPADQGRAQPGRAADRPGPGPAAAAVRAGRAILAPGPPGHLVRPRAGRAPGTVRAAAARRAGRRPSALRPAGQRRGDLAHRAAAARPPARRPLLPARILGTRRRGGPGPRSSALAAAVAARRWLSPQDPAARNRGPATASICVSG